jgi:protein involved in polysaccharide export with SLBB domain
VNFTRKIILLRICWVGFIFLISVFLTGCGVNESQLVLPSAKQLEEFRNAGPVRLEADIDKLVRGKATITGPYRVVPGDVLELRQIPLVLQSVTAELPETQQERTKPYYCRVFEDGDITVPVIGQIPAAGRTLSEIEASIIEAYHTKYSVNRPSVVASVADFRKAKVTITGAVQSPGIYELQNDQMSVVSLIMKAGGIVKTGAAVIRVKQPLQKAHTEQQNQPVNIARPPMPGERQGLTKPRVSLLFRQSLSAVKGKGTLLLLKDGHRVHSEEIDITDDSERKAFINRIAQEYPGVMAALREEEKLLPKDIDFSSGYWICDAPDSTSSVFMLPVKGLNIPFADVGLRDGASVEIEGLNPQVFTVIGLVEEPGAFPYPPNVQYNLLQALSFAGGIDKIADPRYVRVYRQNADGRIIDATFKITGTELIGASNIAIKPGDVVAVEQTSRTHLNLMLAEVVQLKAGSHVYYRYYTGKDTRDD